MFNKSKIFLLAYMLIAVCFTFAWAQDPEYRNLNPFTGNLDATRSDTGINSQWLRLDASNDPLSGDLSVGGNSLTDVEFLLFDTSAVEPAYNEGSMYWNGGIIQIDTDVDHLHYNPGVNLTTKVQNKTGIQIDKGKWVYINGSQGGNATIALASNDVEVTSDDTLGIIQADVADNGFTYIVTAGLAKKQDTSGFSAGDKLYLGTNGDAVTSEPASPAHLIILGIVKKSNVSTGEIDVKINVGWELEEIHDVLITSIADKQTLYWDNANSLWKNSNTLLIDEGNGVIITNGSRLNFRDSAIGIYSQADTFLDLFADGAIRMGNSSASAPTTYMTIETDGDTFWTGSSTGLSFAEISAKNNATETTIAASGQANKVQITIFDTNGFSNNMTPDHANDHVTVIKPGIYLVTISIHIDSIAGVGYEVGMSLYKNNGAAEFTNIHSHRDMSGGGGEAGSMSMSGIISLALNDTIELWGWNETNTQNFIVADVTLSLTQIGGN